VHRRRGEGEKLIERGKKVPSVSLAREKAALYWKGDWDSTLPRRFGKTEVALPKKRWTEEEGVG